MKSFFGRLLLYVIVLGLGMGAAFGAGVAYAKVKPTQEAASSAGQTGTQVLIGGQPAQAASGGQGQGMQGSGARGQAAGGQLAGGPAMVARPTITGTVDSVLPDGITVSSGSGPATKVTLAERAAVIKSLSLADLKKGDRVSVSGQRGSDGAVAAMAIQVLPNQ